MLEGVGPSTRRLVGVPSPVTTWGRLLIVDGRGTVPDTRRAATQPPRTRSPPNSKRLASTPKRCDRRTRDGHEADGHSTARGRGRLGFRGRRRGGGGHPGPFQRGTDVGPEGVPGRPLVGRQAVRGLPGTDAEFLAVAQPDQPEL